MKNVQPRAPDTDVSADLVRRAQRGDRRAFREIYYARVQGVAGQVRRLIGWVPDAEDVVQEVFLQLFRALPGFRGDCSFETWLFRLTHNVGVSYLRQQGNRPIDLPALMRLSEWRAHVDVEAREQLRLLYAALDQLPIESREVFVLFELEGLSLKEIASLKESPLNTVASRVRRTREWLRSTLERQDHHRRQTR